MDRHAEHRDSKRKARERNARMRGRRSVFEIGKAIAKRAREAKAEREAREASPSQTTQRGKRKKG